MNYTEIIEFIKSEHKNGQSHEEITKTLLDGGWKKEDIDSAFNTLNSIINQSTPLNDPVNTHKVVNEKDYPISLIWLFKAPALLILTSVFSLLLIDYFFIFLLLLMPFIILENILRRYNFHYSTDEKYFLIKQGIISKSQRNLPYGVIQNVIVKQDIFDRVFGIATLYVENAIQPGDPIKKQKNFQLDWTTDKNANGVGSTGSKVNIPGIKKSDADALKEILLQRMKEYEIDDSQSGL